MKRNKGKKKVEEKRNKLEKEKDEKDNRKGRIASVVRDGVKSKYEENVENISIRLRTGKRDIKSIMYNSLKHNRR